MLCQLAIVAHESYIVVEPIGFFCIYIYYNFYSYVFIFRDIISANIALNKATYMSSQLEPSTGSAKAVDGGKNPTYAGGQCAISQGGQTALWRVDLGVLSSIHHIAIYPRTENVPWGK